MATPEASVITVTEVGQPLGDDVALHETVIEAPGSGVLGLAVATSVTRPVHWL